MVGDGSFYSSVSWYLSMLIRASSQVHINRSLLMHRYPHAGHEIRQHGLIPLHYALMENVWQMQFQN